MNVLTFHFFVMHFTPARAVAAAKKPAVPAPPIWKKAPQIEARDRETAARYGISPVVATILRAREYSSPEAIEAFLHPTADCLHDPFTLPDIEAAVARLQTALDEREPILIFGDYDVDGVTSTALLVRTLKALKADVSWVIPERHDGYGLSTPAVEAAAESGIKLIISVDCGIGAFEPAARAKQLGVDLIITDHHEPTQAEKNNDSRDLLPDAIAVIDPKRADSRYAFRELSGCGVAFKVLQALLQRRAPQHLESFQNRYVDLVGLAAIADCVPLLDENRYLTRLGLKALANTNKLGMQALIQSAGIKIQNGSLSGRNVGFMLAPRLNAAGRIDSAQNALQLLLSTDENECKELAAKLEELNLARQDLTRRVLQEAVSRVYEETNLSSDMILVVAGEEWPHGVVGLVAGRLTERFCRPAIVLSKEGDFAKGSGRSFADFDLTGVIAHANHFLESGGGHKAACGLSLKTENIEAFKKAALEFAAGVLQPSQLAPTIQADCEIAGEDLTRSLIDDLALLEPCGMDNPEATLLLKNATIMDGRAIGGEGRHVKWRVRAGSQTFDALWWSPGDKADGFAVGQTVDLCVSPELNAWNGIEKIQLIIKAARQTKAR